jgi:hypothetical protein
MPDAHSMQIQHALQSLGCRGGGRNRHHTPEILDAVLIPVAHTRFETSYPKQPAASEQGESNTKLRRVLVEIGYLLLEVIERADETDDARGKTESLNRMKQSRFNARR